MPSRQGSLWALARFLAGEYAKMPLAFIGDMIIPLVIFMIVELATGQGVDSLVGMLVAMAWASGAFALARKLAMYRFYRLLDIFIASPVSQLEFAAAAALAHLLVLVGPAAVALALIAVLEHGLGARAATLILAALMAWGLGVLLGLAMFGRLADPVRINSLASLVNIGLVMLPPVLYPASLLPGPLRTLSQLVPTVALKEAALYMYGVLSSPPRLALLALAAYYVVFAAAAVRATRWGEE